MKSSCDWSSIYFVPVCHIVAIILTVMNTFYHTVRATDEHSLAGTTGTVRGLDTGC